MRVTSTILHPYNGTTRLFEQYARAWPLLHMRVKIQVGKDEHQNYAKLELWSGRYNQWNTVCELPPESMTVPTNVYKLDKVSPALFEADARELYQQAQQVLHFFY